jgi:hypothetical protein
MHAADAPYPLEQLNPPSFIRNIGERQARTLDDAQRCLDNKVIASYRRHGYGVYLLELTSTDQPVGMCGLVKRDSLEDVDSDSIRRSLREYSNYRSPSVQWPPLLPQKATNPEKPGSLSTCSRVGGLHAARSTTRALEGVEQSHVAGAPHATCHFGL